MIELNQARSKPNIVDLYAPLNSTQYCNTETVFLIFPFLQTNITSQMRMTVKVPLWQWILMFPDR